MMLLVLLVSAAAAEDQGNVMYVRTNDGKILRVRSSMSAADSSNVIGTLRAAFGLETLDGADLRQCAEAYLAGIGLTQDEISLLKAKLCD